MINSFQSNQMIQAKIVAKTLRDAGFVVYFAGGFVRDLLMGYQSKDIDIVTNATPQQIKTLFPNVIPVGEQFGVLLVIHKKECFEVATFRKDSDYRDGRHPETVTFVDAQQDAERRDFTINGLLYNPFNKTIIDYVSGQSDIKKKIIRAIGDPFIRFKEDKLRLLRAIRFAARLNFSIEEKTFEAIKTNASQIQQVSAERIRNELFQILSNDNVRMGLDLLKSSHLFDPIFPEIEQLIEKHSQDNKDFGEYNAFEKSKEMLHALTNKTSFPLLFATMLYPWYKIFNSLNIDKSEDSLEWNHKRCFIRKICSRLHFSKKDTLRVKDYINDLSLLLHLTPSEKKSVVKKILRKKHIQNQLQMLKSYEIAHNMSQKEQKTSLYLDLLKKYSTKDLSPPLFVTGKTLLDWGATSSSQFSIIIETMENLQLEDQIKSKKEAKEYVFEHFFKKN